MRSMLMRILAGLLALFLSSCLDVREEYWFERNGSGRIEAAYELPTIALASLGGEAKLKQLFDDLLAEHPGVTLDAFSVEKKGAQSILLMHVHFDSVLELSKLLDKDKVKNPDKASLPEPIEKLLGDIKVKRTGIAVDFQRRIEPGSLFAGGLLSPSREQLKDYQLEYIMHLPTKAAQSNAHEILDDGYTLAWRYELADAIKKPIETNFIAPVPIPWWAWLVLAIVILFLVWRSVLIGRRILRRRVSQ